MKRWYWPVWGVLTLLLGGYFLYLIVAAEDKSELLIGAASHGHYEIEIACGACHTEAFGGGEMLQNACVNCHGEELKVARDSHPKKKFTDPRNADLLEVLDARYCISCHTEHQREQTHAMGLTIAADYCFHCHSDIGEERESHKDLAFDSCASAGCHNFHDNRALFEDFLVANAGGHWLAAVTELVAANRASEKAPHTVPRQVLDVSAQLARHPQIEQQWSLSGHAQAGVGCAGCHSDSSAGWLEKPALAQCEGCHSQEAKGFLAGKHGMRLAAGLKPLQPGMSALAFKADALTAEHGCTACHGAHEFDTRVAAAQACMNCHDDTHTRNFWDSPHGQLTSRAMNDEIPWGRAVSCATCHLPRTRHGKQNSQLDVASIALLDDGALIGVEHNQNAMLRPNEKMIRPVCMSCHSLEFSIDALADENLLNNNFKGKPQKHIPTIDWAIKRVK